MDRENDFVVKRKIRALTYCDVLMLIFVVKDGPKLRYIAVLVYKQFYWHFDHGRQRLNERTACLNGKFLKGFR
jgi:hypothetical protein